MRARPSRNMVWSSASSTLIGTLVFRFSANTHPLRLAACSRRVVYSLSPSGHGPSVGTFGDVPHVTINDLKRYSPNLVEGKFCELRVYGVLRSSGTKVP
jgi:hypothetical protein